MGLNIVTRAQWGARSWRRTPTANTLTPASIVFIHQTESVTLSPRATQAQEIAHLKQIEEQHVGVNGWAAIGYSYLVFPSGRVYEGRGFSKVPAAQESANFGNGAIAFVGNFNRHKTRWAARLSAIRLARLFPGKYMSAHRDVNETDCPGRNLYPQVGRLALLSGKRRIT